FELREPGHGQAPGAPVGKHRVRVDMPPVPSRFQSAGAPGGLAFTGGRLVVVGRRGMVVCAGGGTPELFTQPWDGAPPSQPALSPDGGRAACATAGGKVRVYDVGEGQEGHSVVLHRNHTRTTNLLTVSPDGAWLACDAAPEGELALLPLAAGR